ncbi:hypothetical protein SLS53_007897 [Cytospora paraplurivora]|uniref:Plasmid pRiA4b Orf3-like domain-containing protein n=1 Tax=Cytospora paraplurivora TaxID=2898453 RepID=A0AAN9YDH7_9PEZI
MHKIICKRPNYIIKFHLHPEQIKEPPVIRTLSCPADADFYELHASLQLAFGWAAIHSFDFAVVNPSYSPPTDMMQIIQFQRMQAMNGGNNPASTAPEYLFRITDPVPRTQFSGIDRMHEGGRRHPQTQEKKADEYKLYQLLDNAKWEGKKIVYTYDFGDNWEHFLTVEGRSDATGEFEVLSGTGHYVAEDVGSYTGWEELKAAYRARDLTSEQKEKRSWFEKMAANCDPRGLTGNRVSLFENRDEINWNMRSDHIEDYFEKHRQQHAGRRLERINWLIGQH